MPFRHHLFLLQISTFHLLRTQVFSFLSLKLQPAMLPLFVLLFCISSTPLTLSLNQDGLFLRQAKLQLSDPTNALSNWNDRDATPCAWYGVVCNNATGQVIELDLTNSQLEGPFPISLCRIPSLYVISLSGNSINSSLTSDIANCTNLQHLDLSSNLIVGSIPEALSQIPALLFLDLSFNNLSGDIPARFGEFQKLETLSVISNLLNGTIPSSLGNISTLKLLRLAYNPFIPGPIPSEIGRLTNLEELWFSNSNLIGSIPSNLTHLTKLKNLDLSGNKLTGTIPGSIIELKSIVQIELFENSLSGELPVGMSNLTALRRFDVSTNNLTGSIPDELCSLPLESLNLFENGFEGSLPTSIARSPKLYELKLFSNNLSGRLPGDLGKNSPLRYIDVSYNQFYGEVPANLCKWGVLEDLILIYNSFSGVIPDTLGKCLTLRRVRLRNNNFSGVVPDAFWGLPHLYLLELIDNSLSGQISSSISGANNLSVLLISNNHFTGSIPEEIGSLTNLVEFVAHRNSLTGGVPAGMVKLSQLGKLDLSDNQISGKIPEGIQALRKLNELNLANNQLDGKIPREIGSLPALNYLDLSGNNLSGEIPLELENLKLNLLNLSNNHLSGNIPPSFAYQNYIDSFLGNPGLCGNLSGLCLNYSESKNRRNLWIFRSMFILAGIVFVVGVFWFYCKYKNLKKMKKGFTISKWKSFHKLGFSEFEIVKLMNEHNVIGTGASGKVYKVVLSNGEVVAVKKLWETTKKEETSVGSEKDGFDVEVETLGKIRHKNIVRLWCCCNSGDSKLLVYEYMPNGSLADLLHSSKKSLLDWPTRQKIAIDSAEGLSYLHHDCVPPIVHRDVKSSNILLDGEFGAKVSDFGVAKIVNGITQGAESMSVIAGSCGYIAPEYGYTLRVNEKSDIYSFGVVILELVTGRLPVDAEYGEKDLVKWVSSTLDEKGIEHLVDPTLDTVYMEEIKKILDVGLVCTSSLPINRPSMRKVVKMLYEASPVFKPKSIKKDGILTPYYHNEDVSDQGSRA